MRRKKRRTTPEGKRIPNALAPERARERGDDAIHIAVRHRWKQRQAQTFRIVGIGARQIDFAVPLTVVRLMVYRNVVHLRSNPIGTEAGHYRRTLDAGRWEINPHGA